VPSLHELLDGSARVSQLRTSRSRTSSAATRWTSTSRHPPRPRGARGHGHRRRRLHRLGARAPDRRLEAPQAGPRGAGGEPALLHRPRAPQAAPGARDRARRRGRHRPGAHPPRLRGAPARPRLPRGGLQARPAHGAERRRGGPQQRLRHLRRRAGRRGVRRHRVRPDLHRQGGPPLQHHGRHQAVAERLVLGWPSLRESAPTSAPSASATCSAPTAA
jgi:hypothetical protein